MVLNFKEGKISDTLLPRPAEGVSTHEIQIKLTQGWRTGKHPESVRLTEHKPVIKTNKNHSDYQYSHHITIDWSVCSLVLSLIGIFGWTI